jgi:iron complex outermembrane receptor protein
MELKPFALALFAIYYSGASSAAEVSSELDYYQELPVVLTASRLNQPLSEAPNAMTVIDRKMIAASGFRSIPDLFKLVPGMYVSYYTGNHPFVAYHGSPDQYARSMQVMVDGRSIYLPPLSMVDWTTLPVTVDDIERIEVIRGPTAASHGANSTQGVLNLITRGASGVEGATLSVRRGDKGVNDVIARFGNRGETLDYRMTLANLSDYGYDHLSSPPGNQSIPVAMAAGLFNNSFDNNLSRMLNYRADYHPNARDNFDLQFGYNYNVKNVGWTDSPENPVHDLYSNSGFVQLGWTHLLDADSELRVRYYHIRHDQHEGFASVLVPQPILQAVNTARDEIELQHTLTLGPANRLVYGTGYRHDQVNGQHSSLMPFAPARTVDFRTREWRIFGHHEWRLTPSLLLNTGGMFEHDRRGNEKLSPRIALNYHLTPQHTLRTGVSMAYRTPALMESNFPAIQPGELFVLSATASPGLQPERLISREIGYIGELPEMKASLDLRLFSDLLTHGIFQHRGTFINGMSAEYRGFEATLKHGFSEDSELILNYAHELAGSNGETLAAAGYRTFRSVAPWTRDALAGSVPRNSASLLYMHRLRDDLNFSAAYYQQGMLQPFDRGPVDIQMLQRRVDVRLAQVLNLNGENRAELALVVQNLFNQGYTEYVANNLFNRRGYVTLTMKW